MNYSLYLKPTWRRRALEMPLVWNSKVVLVLNFVLVVQSKAPYISWPKTCFVLLQVSMELEQKEGENTQLKERLGDLQRRWDWQQKWKWSLLRTLYFFVAFFFINMVITKKISKILWNYFRGLYTESDFRFVCPIFPSRYTSICSNLTLSGVLI